MAGPLVWDVSYSKNYQLGLDRGVLYLSSGTEVFPWNGLVSVKDQGPAGSAKAYYIDGVKYLETSPLRDYKATISAYSAPREFGRCLGENEIRRGVALFGQPRESFGMAYRSMLGKDHYQIHLIYNAIVSLGSKRYSTLSKSISPIVFEWDIDAVPISCGDHRPTAHYILDSRKVLRSRLTAVERLLYGGNLEDVPLDGQTSVDGEVDGGVGGTDVDGNVLVTLPDSQPRLPTPCEIRDILNPS